MRMYRNAPDESQGGPGLPSPHAYHTCAPPGPMFTSCRFTAPSYYHFFTRRYFSAIVLFSGSCFQFSAHPVLAVMALEGWGSGDWVPRVPSGVSFRPISDISPSVMDFCRASYYSTMRDCGCTVSAFTNTPP